MELDLRFKQFDFAEMNVVNGSTEQGSKGSKPYQEVVDFLESNKSNFYFKDFSQLFKNVQGVQQLFLSDGTKVVVGKRNNIMNLAIEYPDKTRFVGTWSNIIDANEFYEKCQTLE